jgi:hypothetical protein
LRSNEKKKILKFFSNYLEKSFLWRDALHLHKIFCKF